MDNQAQILDLARLQQLAEAANASGCELREILGDTCAMYTAEGSLIEFFEAATPAVVLKLIAEAQAFRKDSARYRCLRNPRRGQIEVVEWIGPHATAMTGEDLDELLDAEMGRGEQ
ncbi:hypothetical protein [Pseudomonas sp. MF7453]|uniref:hypothetical protein n=1 Tax=Pseudomonas sp. MF7453 TaxID=2797539 RepID=UPI0018E87FC5|nr:hypothetical protein [Pseudomonas sp. MF7453]MBJ2216411.1 hypothetical protein [Pseudomonas sp. MF7453]